MSVAEIAVGQRVLATLSKSEIEVAKVKGIGDDGRIIIRTTEGQFREISPECVIKSFGW